MSLVHNLQTYELTANGNTEAFQIAPYQSVTLTLRSPATTVAVVKIQHSLANTQPDFTAAASDTNPWSYLSSIDLADTGSVVGGATGYTIAGPDCTNIIASTDTSRWLAFEVSGYTAGRVIIDLLTTD